MTQKVLPERWTKVKLGDVAQDVRIVEHNPLESGLERLVGLEHMDSESLHLTRWGMIKDGTSFQRRFSKGQILLGKRRAYLHKVVVADFDGLCSSDILVIKPKDKMLIPELLPFVIQDERFFDFAVRTSSGSLSPRTKWKYLAKYEIPLPPIDEQYRIAKILWAAEDCLVKYEELLLNSEALKKVLAKQLLTRGIGHREYKDTQIGEIPKEWDVIRLGDTLELCQYGLSLPMYEVGKYPIVRMDELVAGYVSPEIAKRVDLDKETFQAFRLRKGDILFNRTNSYDLVGRTGIFLLDGDYVFASYLIRLRPKRTFEPRFLNYYLAASHDRLKRLATKAVHQANINATNLKNFRIPHPPLNEQQEITKMISTVDSVIDRTQEHIETTKVLKMRLLTELLTKGLSS